MVIETPFLNNDNNQRKNIKYWYNEHLNSTKQHDFIVVGFQQFSLKNNNNQFLVFQICFLCKNNRHPSQGHAKAVATLPGDQSVQTSDTPQRGCVLSGPALSLRD